MSSDLKSGNRNNVEATSTAAVIDIPFGTKTPLDPEHIGVGAELPSCHSGVDAWTDL